MVLLAESASKLITIHLQGKKKKKVIKTLRGKQVIGTVSLKIFTRFRIFFFFLKLYIDLPPSLTSGTMSTEEEIPGKYS